MVSKLFPSVTVQLKNCSVWSKGACRRPKVTSRWDGKSLKSQGASKIGLQPPHVLCWPHVLPLQVAGVTAVVREWHRAKNPWCGKTWFQNTSGTYSAQRRVDGHLSTSVRWSLWHGQGLNSLQQRRKKHAKMQNFWGTSTTRRFLPWE